jgi:hypothetical protein
VRAVKDDSGRRLASFDAAEAIAYKPFGRDTNETQHNRRRRLTTLDRCKAHLSRARTYANRIHAKMRLDAHMHKARHTMQSKENVAPTHTKVLSLADSCLWGWQPVPTRVKRWAVVRWYRQLVEGPRGCC